MKVHTRDTDTDQSARWSEELNTEVLAILDADADDDGVGAEVVG
jgi:hypothetical protein